MYYVEYNSGEGGNIIKALVGFVYNGCVLFEFDVLPNYC